MSKIHHALILAAGFGKRLRSVMNDVPKPLAMINGKSALEIAINGLSAVSSINDLYINVHWQANKIIQALSEVNCSKNINILEEKTLLDTGGGILNAINQSGCDAILVKNSDCVFFSEVNIYNDFLDHFYKTNATAMLMIIKNDGRKILGDFTLTDSGHLFRAQDHNDYIYVGCGIFTKKFFQNHLSGNIFPLSKLLFCSAYYNYQHYNYRGMILNKNVQWFDIGTPETLASASLAASNIVHKLII